MIIPGPEPDRHATFPRFTPELLLAELETTPECFRITGGTLGSRGQTEEVEIANYHAPIQDLLDFDKHVGHLMAGDKASRMWMPLEISDEFKYAFDVETTWFRVGRGAFLHNEGRRVPVRLVTINYEDVSFSWLYHDQRGAEADNPAPG